MAQDHNLSGEQFSANPETVQPTIKSKSDTMSRWEEYKKTPEAQENMRRIGESYTQTARYNYARRYGHEAARRKYPYK